MNNRNLIQEAARRARAAKAETKIARLDAARREYRALANAIEAKADYALERIIRKGDRRLAEMAAPTETRVLVRAIVDEIQGEVRL